MAMTLPWREYDKWLLGPAPVSKIQKITVELRSFEIKNLKERVLNDEYPCRLFHPGHPKTVWFWEIRGHGHPPKDIRAQLGDIYIDEAAVPIVNVYQKVVDGWIPWWDPASSAETLKKFSLLPHPYVQDRFLTTAKGRGFGSIRETYLSYLCLSAIKGRGESTPDRDLSLQGELAEMFPSKTVNHGAIALARPVGSDVQVNDRSGRTTTEPEDYESIVVSTCVKTRTIQNQEPPVNQFQGKSFQENLERVNELEKNIREEKISSKSTIDDLKKTLAEEREAREKFSVKLNEATTQLKTVKALNDDLNAKYEMVLHRLGDEQGKVVGIKRKLYEICSELQVDHNQSEASRTYRHRPNQ